MTNKLTVTQQTLKSDLVKVKFQEVLGTKANGFVSSLLSIVGNSNLKTADANSVINAAMKAAALDLPIEPTLGFAYIIPYKNKGREEAQFQIGYKGLIQLALRSGQLTGLNSGVVYESQFVSYDPLFEELELDFSQPQGEKLKGYFASMKLANGFKKVTFWTKEQVQAHGKRFSKSYSYRSSPWSTDFDAMAQKTVMKAMISKYAPLSQEMQQAIVADDESETIVPQDVTPEVPLISIDEEVIDPESKEPEIIEVTGETLSNEQVEEVMDEPFPPERVKA